MKTLLKKIGLAFKFFSQNSQKRINIITMENKNNLRNFIKKRRNLCLKKLQKKKNCIIY